MSGTFSKHAELYVLSGHSMPNYCLNLMDIKDAADTLTLVDCRPRKRIKIDYSFELKAAQFRDAAGVNPCAAATPCLAAYAQRQRGGRRPH